MQNEIYDDEEIEIVIHGRNVDTPLRPSSYSFMSEDVEFIPFSKPSLAKFNWFVKACIVISTVCLLIIGANLLFSGDIKTNERNLKSAWDGKGVEKEQLHKMDKRQELQVKHKAEGLHKTPVPFRAISAREKLLADACDSAAARDEKTAKLIAKLSAQQQQLPQQDYHIGQGDGQHEQMPLLDAAQREKSPQPPPLVKTGDTGKEGMIETTKDDSGASDDENDRK